MLRATPTAAALCTVFAVTALASRVERRRTSVGDARLDRRWRPRDEHFGYEGDEGPEHWPALFPSCGGRSQSPVDIAPRQAQPATFPSPLVVPAFEWEPSQVKIWNNGHTVMLLPVDAASVRGRYLTGGPLQGRYCLVQLHFHWGDAAHSGSEHAIGGSYYGMEMHMVFQRKTKRRPRKFYRTDEDLAVIAVFLVVSNTESKPLKPIVDHLPLVEEVGAEVPMMQKVSTANLVPCVCTGVFVYNGSLTTPPCSESVTWIVFRRPIIVSPKQVAQFRKIKSPTGVLSRNRRPVQPLNDRLIYRSCSAPLSSCCVLVAVWALSLRRALSS